MRRAAHARTRSWGDDELRLECAVDEIAVAPVARGRDPVTGEGDLRTTLTVDEVSQLARDAPLYVAWCPSHGCCGHPAEGHVSEAVTVRCTDEGACDAVGDNFGDCLTIDCAFY